MKKILLIVISLLIIFQFGCNDKERRNDPNSVIRSICNSVSLPILKHPEAYQSETVLGNIFDSKDPQEKMIFSIKDNYSDFYRKNIRVCPLGPVEKEIVKNNENKLRIIKSQKDGSQEYQTICHGDFYIINFDLNVLRKFLQENLKKIHVDKLEKSLRETTPNVLTAFIVIKNPEYSFVCNQKKLNSDDSYFKKELERIKARHKECTLKVEKTKIIVSAYHPVLPAKNILADLLEDTTKDLNKDLKVKWTSFK